MTSPPPPGTLLRRDGLRPLSRGGSRPAAPGRVHLLARPDGAAIEVFPGDPGHLARIGVAFADTVDAMGDAEALRVRREISPGDSAGRLVFRVEGARSEQLRALYEAAERIVADDPTPVVPTPPMPSRSDERAGLEALAAQLRADLARLDAERSVLRADLRVLEQEIRDHGDPSEPEC